MQPDCPGEGVMFSVIFASALGFVLLMFVMIVRQMISANRTGQGNFAGANPSFMHTNLLEVPIMPTNIDGVTPFYYSDRGNLIIGPPMPGVNCDLLPQASIQPNNLFNRY